MTWTPGPWEHDGKFTVTISVQTGEYAGLEYPFRVTRVDDARLIALAPDLIEMLIHLQDKCGSCWSPTLSEQVASLIARARGEA